MVEFEKEVVTYLNIPSIPKKEWNQTDSFENGVAIVNLSIGRQAYAVCSFDKETDKEPRITKVFSVEPFGSIDKVFVVPAYMDNNTADVDLDAESKKRAEQLAAEASELENDGVVDEAIEEASLTPLVTDAHAEEKRKSKEVAFMLKIF